MHKTKTYSESLKTKIKQVIGYAKNKEFSIPNLIDNNPNNITSFIRDIYTKEHANVDMVEQLMSVIDTCTRLFENYQSINFDIELCCTINNSITSNGQIRKYDVHSAGNYYVTWSLVTQRLEVLLKTINVMMNSIDKLTNDNDRIKFSISVAALFMEQFLCIHPFEDGNGRTVRILFALLLYKRVFNTPVVLSNDDKYVQILRDSKNNPLLFVSYVTNFINLNY